MEKRIKPEFIREYKGLGKIVCTRFNPDEITPDQKIKNRLILYQNLLKKNIQAFKHGDSSYTFMKFNQKYKI